MTVEVVAEVGSNWNGNLRTLDKLAIEVASAGADTLKVQHYPPALGPHPFTKLQLRQARQIAHSHGLKFLASVFDQRTLDEYLDVCDPDRVKIASPELTRDDLLEQLPPLVVLLSTGMSTLEQIDHANEILDGDADSLVLLHCVSAYPAPPREMNLRVLKAMKARYGHPVGLSDHSLNPTVAPTAAVALGAILVEKHLTLSRDQKGPDHAYALGPAGFADMVSAVRACDRMLGSGKKRVMPSEDPTDRR